MVVREVSSELESERDNDKAWKKEVKESKSCRFNCLTRHLRHRETYSYRDILAA